MRSYLKLHDLVLKQRIAGTQIIGVRRALALAPIIRKPDIRREHQYALRFSERQMSAKSIVLGVPRCSTNQ
jgi:hypothetical protein